MASDEHTGTHEQAPDPLDHLPRLEPSLQPPPVDAALEDYVAPLLEDGSLSRADWELYKSLKVTKHRHKKRLSIQAPTWGMRYPVRTLADFIDDLADPKTRATARCDYASIPGGGARSFFQDTTILRKNARPGRCNPINDGSGRAQTGQALTLAEWFTPNLLATYALAADYSTVGGGDATGVSLVHFDPARQEFVLDFSLQIKAPIGSRIDYEPIRQLARDLRDRGFRICAIGFDQHQSGDTYNILENEGFVCEVVKHADSLKGCNTAKDMITSGRFIYGECDAIFIGEAEELQVINERRIDHLSSGGVYNSKDVWDSVVNAVHLCHKYALEEQGMAIRIEDLATYPIDLDFAEADTIAAQGMSDAERQRRQLPNNGHALLAYAYCRYQAAQDPDSVVIAVGAVSMKDNSVKLLDVQRLKATPRQLIHALSGIQRTYEGMPFFQTYRGQSVECYVPDLPFLDHIKRAGKEEAPHMGLMKLDVSLTEQIRMSSLQARAKEGKLLIPDELAEKPRLRWAINQLVSWPFVPKDYGVLALEGLMRIALDAEFVIPTASSRVIELPYGDL